MPMTNAQISAVFEEIAAMLELRKDNIFKIRAYRKVARAIEELNEPVTGIVAENKIGQIPGAGEAITKKITELVETGRLEYHERLKEEIAGQTRGAGS